MKRTYIASKNSATPIVLNSVELEEAERKKKLGEFEARIDFEKLEENNKFFEKEKQRMIQQVMMEDQLRHAIQGGNLNQSYQSAYSNYGDKTFLANFQYANKPVQKQEMVQPLESIDPALKEDMTRRSLSEVYNQRADKISSLKAFMVL